MKSKKLDDIAFNSSSGLKLSVGQVSDQINEFMKADPSRPYKVIIGTDSEVLSEDRADFVTAIVVHREGNGGRYFWRRIEGENFYTMRDRLIHEVMISLDIAKDFLKMLEEDLLNADWGFEIHVDVGDNGPSRDFIQEVVGMVRANDFEAKTKPESYAASKVADRHV